MAKSSYVILAGAIILIALLILGSLVVNSVWFLRSFVPESSPIIWAGSSRHPLIQAAAGQANLIGLDLEREGIEAGLFSQFVLAKSGDSTYFVGRRSYGTWVRVQTGPKTDALTAKIILSRAWRGVREVFSHAGELGAPIGILHIAKNSIPLADTTYDAIVTQAAASVRITLKHPHGQSTPAIALEIQQGESGIKFALPGTALAHVPSNLQSAVLTKILDNIHVVHKQAALKKMIADASFITAQASTQGTGVAITRERSGIATALQQLVAQEEGYSHPIKRAFRLPDGSLGFELRPGEAKAAWSTVSQSCSYYTGEKQEWWVCSLDNTAALATSRAVAEELLTGHDLAVWHVAIGQDMMPPDALPGIKAIRAIGTSEETLIELQ